jgi:hypothetical protein
VALAALAVATLPARAAAAQQHHMVIVTGLAGEPPYAAAFRRTAASLYDLARSWGVRDSSLVLLSENPAADAARSRGRATRDEIAATLLGLSRRAAAGDVVTVFLIGHGSGQAADSRVSLPGPDATAADFATWLAGFTSQTVVFVNAASASGDFLATLAAPQRVVVTATKSALERNETIFAEHFVQGLTAGRADADKDDRITLLEAFTYARREVARAYEAGNRLLTEHAQLSDTALAATVVLGAGTPSDDPQVAALVAERRALEAQVAALRARKATLDSTTYERELERLLIEIATRTQAIRATAGGTARP